MEKSEVITLMEFSTLGEADVYKSLLDSAGINSVIENEILAVTLPFLTQSIKLSVAAEDALRARELLNATFDMDEFRKETHTEKRKKPAGKTVAIKKGTPKTGKCATADELTKKTKATPTSKTVKKKAEV